MRNDSLIFRIRNIVSAVEARTGLDELDLATREVLKFIGAAEAAGEAPQSSTVVRGAAIGTGPTTFARLTALEELGWVVSSRDADDGRMTRWHLSTHARRAFTEMSKKLRAMRVT